MFVDAHELADDALIESDLVVVGGGAAGITLAMAFLHRGETVTLIESGGLDYEDATQALYEGRNLGWDYFDFDVSRLRYWGGSTNHWAARCRPLAALDFEHRPWLEHSGWPLTREELDPYYEQAQAICGLGLYTYDLRDWVDAPGDLPRFDPHQFVPSLWQFGHDLELNPVNFGTKYRAPLAAADNVKVVLHANLFELLVSVDGTHVAGADVRTLGGKRLTVIGRRYVLACGGLETPRLLLASNSVVPHGLGNRHDLVGRFHMDHPHLIVGQLAVREGVSLDEFSHTVHRHGHVFEANLTLAPALQRTQRTSSLDLTFKADRGWSEGVAAARRIYHAWKSSRWPDDLTGDVVDVISDLGGSFKAILGFLGWITPEPIPQRYLVRIFLEQAPHPDNRIQLGSERDALGMPRLELDWRLNHQDKHTVVVAVQALANEVGRLDLGRLKVEDWVLAGPDAWPGGALCNYHHMGTTRMADDPHRGVVDRNQRVHGMDNLYLASSSVFPTSGSANPTLTIVAMTLRLAELLQQSDPVTAPPGHAGRAAP